MNVNNNQNDDPHHRGADNADNVLGGGTANSTSAGAAAFVAESNNNDQADEEEENERVLQQQEEEEQRAAIAAATARRENRSLRERRKLASILDDKNYHRLPSRQRNKINELVDVFHSNLGDWFDNLSDAIAAHEVDEEEENERVLQREEDEEQSSSELVPVGTRVSKKFNDGIVYHGTILSYDTTHKFYFIRYDDGDQEEMEDAEVRDCLNRSLRERRKLAFILGDTDYHRLPLPQRRIIIRSVDRFLSQLGEDIYDMCTDQRAGENYEGLDSERDTEEEVETALRLFPNNLRKRKARQGIRVDTNFYPIQCLTEMYNPRGQTVCHNVKAVSFIHLFARLAIEFGTFDEKKRGGLLIKDSMTRNILHCLADTCRHQLGRRQQFGGDDHYRRADNLFHTEMVKLKRAGLFLKKDIRNFGLLSMCNGVYWFSEQKAKFIIDWDQNSLISTELSTDGKSILHLVALRQSTKGFRFVLDQIIKHFGKEKGITTLFSTDDANETPLGIACRQKLNRQDIMNIVEETLAGYPDPPLNNASLMIHMTTNHQKFNHLDCVYFLIRRQPDKVMDWRLPITNKDDATDDADVDADNNGRKMLSNRSEDNRKRKREDASIQPPSL